MAAISVDTPEINRRQIQKLGFRFILLSDTQAQVIRRYDLLHPGGGPRHTDIARPAEFLIDSTGTILWAKLTASVAVRARPEQVLKALDEISGKASKR